MRDRLYVHVVWTTRDREATIDLSVARFLARFLPAVARQERAGVHALGVVSTHVHLLLQLHPTTSIPRLLQRLKGGSSVLANREGHAGTRPLRWARGYGIVSVSPRALEAVRRYVLGQAVHHPREAIPGWENEQSVEPARLATFATEVATTTTIAPSLIAAKAATRLSVTESDDASHGSLHATDQPSRGFSRENNATPDSPVPLPTPAAPAPRRETS